MASPAIACPSCGQRYTALAELREVYQLGASLKGLCHCGQRFSVARLWESTARAALEKGEAPPARPREYRQLVMF